MRHRRLAAVATLALLAACNLTSPAPSVEPGASAQADDAECPSVNIRGPSGAPVELTGVWRSNDQWGERNSLNLGVYYIHQHGSCLYWMGLSRVPGSDPGDVWANVFVGTLRNDFTIVGRLGDVPFNRSGDLLLEYWSLSLRVEFDQSDDAERPVLRLTDASGGQEGTVWVLEESLSMPTDIDGTLGGTVLDDDTACPWIESDGERYELIGSGVWRIGNMPLSVQDGSGHIVARIGDPLRVSGRVSAALGSGCTESAILVEELDPKP